MAVQDAGRKELAQTVREQQDEITAITERNRTLEGILLEYSKEEQTDNAVIDLSSPVKKGKLRMYFLSQARLP